MSHVLVAKERTDFKQSTLRELRENGEIPAVVYGSENGSQAISVNYADLKKTLKEIGRNGIISLNCQGKEHQVMLSEYQSDPLKQEMYHADFLIVDMSEEVQVNVRVNLVGQSIGVKDGGVLQQSLHEVTVTATPGDIPESIDVDVTELEVNETLYISDLNMKQGVTLNHSGDEVVASVLAPRQEREISTGEQQEGGIPTNEEGRETAASPESQA
ncbi:50S ribosomal protein L25/general stress protein Ctc [Peribacillus asahii]|uniref:Large ribosomal subunit protein bL25 n=1 Tax=Peribacillus asahii TaxID=228899 RepID=A0A3Q9RJT3_9BACI|nr:50S ribosomal protein L25/general stress protein Ctc [Peribacillus asahii]AZV40799.1 50S ribosomal protein L25 [Peribacillus asahii]USK85241.1 50S ribosomal protein L25/general stress protein Ctc [Peribacillus asahii]